MDAKTLEALKASIAKWERNAEAERPDDVLIGARDCPLCRIFHWAFGGNDCKGCPIYDAGHHGCEKTPYAAADTAFEEWQYGNGKLSDFRAAARDEVSFLKSLLPEETP